MDYMKYNIKWFFTYSNIHKVKKHKGPHRLQKYNKQIHSDDDPAGRKLLEHIAFTARLQFFVDSAVFIVCPAGFGMSDMIFTTEGIIVDKAHVGLLDNLAIISYKEIANKNNALILQNEKYKNKEVCRMFYSISYTKLQTDPTTLPNTCRTLFLGISIGE